jgi:hypothetical protein
MFKFHMVDERAGYKQEVDSISCPSSLNRSCQLLPKEYTITVPTQLNVSKAQFFPSPKDINVSSVNRQQDQSYALNTSSNSSDVASIFSLVANSLYAYKTGPIPGYWQVETPLTIVVSTLNITQNRTYQGGNFVNLTVPSGYNMTLYYNPFMTFTWGRVSGCDNRTLDGFPMHIVMPYFTQYIGEFENFTVLAGKFLAEETCLNDSVVVNKKSMGLSLMPWTGWSVVSTGLGLLGFILL